ncbi:related to beta-mannosidase [Cephalotrichum gorgonifer]|uniref:Beta-mannosidase B n=1 Tax=Cephalotrichum gorgonifer TaxID=2041049 RepID=A0AAE8MUX9_9PEZI|nr:related to beta-mannosidase [Cephalotrichum gorgonifer]
MASISQTLAGWRWRRHADSEEWHPCAHSNPTTEIFADLVDAKRIPDPFLDQNELLVQWVGETDWEYSCEFIHESSVSHCHQDLVFEGLDTYATVFLNDRHILTSTNMFHRHRINVTDTLQSGANVLRITFLSALHEGRVLEEKHGKFRAFNGEGSRLHVRKAAYHYGWDWGPVLLSCGPYREIRLESYSSMVYDVFASATVAEDLQQATLDVSWSAIFDQDVEVDVTVISPSQHTFHSLSTLAAGDTDGKVTFDIPQPELWCPVGHGPQPLYTVEVRVRSQNGDTAHAITTAVGIRRIRLMQEPLLNEPGTSFFVEVNNQPVYILGTNYIPGHSFLTRLTPGDYAATIDSCLDGNQNMLRVWAGGIYEHDSFYAECDRRGVLVWQDFMFACGQFPCYPEFAQSVTREAADQLKRLRNHCCIVLYAGNNEDYQVIESLKLEYNPDDHSGDWTATDFPARSIYETLLPASMSEHCPSVPYHPGSPWGGNRTDDRTVGDIHQWNVWHGTQEPYQMWDKLTGRFVSEFGMLSFPSARSVSRFVTDPAQRHPQSAVMELHNKAEGGERRLALYVLENIRVDSMHLESWAYATQLIQAECLEFALNDCWPVASWGMIDFYGERKLAFYSTKRASAPLAIGIHRSTPDLKLLTSPPPQVPGAPHDLSQKSYVFDVWAVNTSLLAADVIVEVRLFDTETGELREKQILGPQTLLPNRSLELVEDVKVDDKTAVQAILSDSAGRIVARASDWPQPLKYVRLPPSYDINLQVLDGRVEVSSNVPLKCLELYMADNDRKVCWDDNGVDVFPSDTYVINATGLVEGDDVRMRYYGVDWIANKANLKASVETFMNGDRDERG